MLIAIIIILALLWFFGYIALPNLNLPNPVLFTINNHAVTISEILILLVLCWAIGALPRRLQLIGAVLLALWVLSALGFIAIAGLANILIVVIIVGLIVSLFVGKK